MIYDKLNWKCPDFHFRILVTLPTKKNSKYAEGGFSESMTKCTKH